jgi:HSP20 family protein
MEERGDMSERGGIGATDKHDVDTTVHQELRSGNWFVPATDIYETPEKVVLVMDMPGVCFDCANVNVVDDELVVTGHVTHGEDQDDYVLYREYDVGHYHRHFGLPPTVDRDKIEASMVDGVLTVTMPKVAEFKPRRIPIKVNQ